MATEAPGGASKANAPRAVPFRAGGMRDDNGSVPFPDGGAAPDLNLRFLDAERPGQARLAATCVPGAGPGKPVWVFLHGLGGSRLGDKARRFRDWLFGRGPGFFALDFTGHGDSGGDCRGLTLSRNLEDIDRGARFLEAEAPGAELVLVGSSMGGVAALWYAALHPARVRLVVAIAPALRMAARVAASLSAEERRRWRERGFLPVPIGEDTLEIGPDIVADEDDFLPDRLAATLRAPTLILHGTDDAVVPIGLSRNFVEECPSARLQEIEGGDHRLQEHRDFLFEAAWERDRELAAG